MQVFFRHRHPFKAIFAQLTMTSAYQHLINRLDEFIRKYYRNQLLRGGIYVLATLPAFYLLVIVLEYFGHFNTSIRTFLFYSFLVINAAITAWFIVRPLLKLYHIGPVLSHEQAARIIGDHFAHVKDKLLNILQLRNLADTSAASRELIEAAINQKIEWLRPIPFTAAIDLRKNLRYLRWAIIPMIILISLLLTSPAVVKDSTYRLIQHRTYFEKPAPFTFIILNEKLSALQEEDYELKITTQGSIIPSRIYVEDPRGRTVTEKEGRNLFTCRFKNLQQSFSFRLLAEGYESRPYLLEVLPKPVITSFDVMLDYPVYLKKENEILKNSGDLVVPVGTRITWHFHTRNTETIALYIQDTVIAAHEKEKNLFAFSHTAVRSQSYVIAPFSTRVPPRDSLRYTLQVIPDLYPSITVEQEADSVTGLRIYFHGTIKDDYGFSNLRFVCRFLNSEQADDKPFYENIPINRNVTQERFFYYRDFTSRHIQAGQQVEYYFEIWDNDGWNGPKATRSQVQVLKAPTPEELHALSEQSNSRIKENLQESIQQARQLQKEIAETSKRLLNKKELTFDDRKKIQDLLNRQKELENKVKNLQQENLLKLARENEYKNTLQEIAEKHRQLQELIDKLMSEEMRKLMEELERLLSQLDKNRLQEMLDQMKLDVRDFEKRLDRTLELFKQLEVEQRLKEAIQTLEKLAEQQDKLSEQTKDNQYENRTLQEKQQQLNQQFENFRQELKNVEQKNKELEFPQPWNNTEPEQEEISNLMQESEQELSKNNRNKASRSQKKASDRMRQMAARLQQQMLENEMDQQAEDIHALRALLENLIRFSFEQENLMQQLKTMEINNPQYVKIGQQQRKLKEDAQVIEDSLFALSKRVIQIQTIVNEQVAEINRNVSAAITSLQDRFVAQARHHQQNIMMAANNLALMLSEALEQMQQQMMSLMPNPSACKKPGQGQPRTAAQLRQMQQQLNEMIRQLKDKMENRQGQGKKLQGLSEELARLAAEQEAIRRELQRLNLEENKDGQGTLGNLDKIARQMEETEKDLVNKRITNEMLLRQQDILTRLLESEKAERQRELDEQRESNVGKDIPRPDNARFEEYLKLKMRQEEWLKTVPPSLTPFYRNLVNNYFRQLENTTR
jgi:hypothetical protein